ncbi:MAG: heterodisulfide reductase-related iron-sulfur binding cluster, partial [Raoultibacter sp.]
RMVADAAGVAADDVLVSIHDSCPDRDTGEFADGIRSLIPRELMVSSRHERERSLCCGSLLRAEGKDQAADALAHKLGEDGRALGVSAFVVGCASCAFQLTVSQSALLVFHYLELLYDWRIPWENASTYMKLRFLFDEALGAVESGGGSRTFAALDAPVDKEPSS